VRSAEIARTLLASPREVVPLHGDVHHGNILVFEERGWLAFDPKRLMGERGFDYANLFCNPNDTVATAPGRLATAGECRRAGGETRAQAFGMQELMSLDGQVRLSWIIRRQADQ
jgi:streptomycin 6-kinase